MANLTELKPICSSFSMMEQELPGETASALPVVESILAQFLTVCLQDVTLSLKASPCCPRKPGGCCLYSGMMSRFTSLIQRASTMGELYPRKPWSWRDGTVGRVLTPKHVGPNQGPVWKPSGAWWHLLSSLCWPVHLAFTAGVPGFFQRKERTRTRKSERTQQAS